MGKATLKYNIDKVGSDLWTYGGFGSFEKAKHYI